MSNKISDRELLAFCSLAKLKLEFSQYKTKEKNDDVWKYKTPRKLIQEELEGQRNRRLNKSDNQLIEDLNNKEREIKEKMIKNDENIGKYGILGGVVATSLKEIEDDWKRYHEQVKEIMKKGINIGMFYDDSELSKLPFLYGNKNDLQKRAPMLMEYYDISTDEKGNYTGVEEGKFLDEWEILYAGDPYEISKDLFEKLLLDLKGIEKDKLLEEALKKIPTRYEIRKSEEKAKRVEMTMTGIGYLASVFLAAGLKNIKEKLSTKTVEKEILYKQLPIKDGKIQNGKAPKYFKNTMDGTVKVSTTEINQLQLTDYHIVEISSRSKIPPEFSSGFQKVTSTNKGLFKLLSIIEDFNAGYGAQIRVANAIAKGINDSEEVQIMLQAMREIPYKYNVNFETKGAKVVFLRNIKEPENCILVVDEQDSQVKESLIKGLIPREIVNLLEIVSNLLKEHYFKQDETIIKFNPTITGVDTGGELGTILGMMHSESPNVAIRCFYREKPITLARIPFLTVADVKSSCLSTGPINTWEVVDETLIKPFVETVAINAVAAIFITKSTAIVFGTFTNPWSAAFFLFFCIKSFLKEYFINQKFEKLYTHLFEKGIIEGRLEEQVKTDLETLKYSGITNTSVLDEDNLKIGHVNGDKLKDKYSIANHDGESIHGLELSEYLQIYYYREIEGIKNIKKDDTTGNIVVYKERFEAEEDYNDYAQYKILTTYMFKASTKGGKKEIKKTEIRETSKLKNHVFEVEDVSILELDNKLEDKIGELLAMMLKQFNDIQSNYKNKEMRSYYLNNNKPVKTSKLEEFKEDAAKEEKEYIDLAMKPRLAKVCHIYNFFPYIGDNGNISDEKIEINNNFIGSYLRSSFKDNNDKHFDEYGNLMEQGNKYKRKEELIDLVNGSRIGSGGDTSKKTINEILMAKILDNKWINPMHYGGVREIEKKPEILEKYWKVIPSGKENFLAVGHLSESGDKFKKEALTYSYDLDLSDKVLSRAVLVPIDEEYSQTIAEVSTTKVVEGAKLRCSASNIVYAPKVANETSKKTKKQERIEKQQAMVRLNAEKEGNIQNSSESVNITESRNIIDYGSKEEKVELGMILKIPDKRPTSEDGKRAITTDNKVSNIQIVGGVTCGLRRNEPCSYAPVGEWQEGSNGGNVNGGKALLNKSWCQCAVGGKIEIVDSNTDSHSS